MQRVKAAKVRGFEEARLAKVESFVFNDGDIRQRRVDNGC